MSAFLGMVGIFPVVIAVDGCVNDEDDDPAGAAADDDGHFVPGLLVFKLNWEVEREHQRGERFFDVTISPGKTDKEPDVQSTG